MVRFVTFAFTNLELLLSPEEDVNDRRWDCLALASLGCTEADILFNLELLGAYDFQVVDVGVALFNLPPWQNCKVPIFPSYDCD